MSTDIKIDLQEFYFKELKAWNKVHRLVGSKDLHRLYSESKRAFATLPDSASSRNVVDVGAGSGILGFAGLFSGYVDKIVFVEPDAKKAAYLIYMKAQILKIEPIMGNKMIILSKKLQDVSRETLDSFFGSSAWVLIARAFSSGVGLKEAVEASELKGTEVFSFALSPENKSMLKRL